PTFERASIVPAIAVYAYTVSPWVDLCAAKRSAATVSGRDASCGGPCRAGRGVRVWQVEGGDGQGRSGQGRGRHRSVERRAPELEDLLDLGANAVASL